MAGIAKAVGSSINRLVESRSAGAGRNVIATGWRRLLILDVDEVIVVGCLCSAGRTQQTPHQVVERIVGERQRWPEARFGPPHQRRLSAASETAVPRSRAGPARELLLARPLTDRLRPIERRPAGLCGRQRWVAAYCRAEWRDWMPAIGCR